MKRVIVVGDLQGCAKEANALLKKVNATANDWVIFAGDLVDRGPDNDECMEIAMAWQSRQGLPSAVRGNHEDRHLQYLRKERAGKDPKVQIPSHIETRKQLKKHHYKFMEELPLFLRVPEHNAAVVHAGAWPGRPLEAQSEHHLMHIQMISPGNPAAQEKSLWPSKVSDSDRDVWKFWTHHWNGPERLVFGHTVMDRPLITPYAVGIDGGCCFGEELRCVIIPDWEVVSVPSQTKHLSKRNAATGEDVKLWNIHGSVNTFS